MNLPVNDGFSLTEIMLALGIVAIMLALAVPSYRHLLQHNQTKLTVNRLVTAIQFARSEAMKRRQIVTLCPNNHQGGCGDNWQAGWLVVDKQHQQLQSFPAITNNTQLRLHSNHGRQYQLVFSPRGFTQGGQQGSFYLCSQKRIKAIIFTRSGRVRVTDVQESGQSWPSCQRNLG